MDSSLIAEELPVRELISINKTLGQFLGPSALDQWLSKHPANTITELKDTLMEMTQRFPSPLAPLRQLIAASAIPIIYMPGWLENDDSYAREYLVLLIPRPWYDSLMELLITLSETTVSNIVDPEFENLTRKRERLSGVEIDTKARRVTMVLKSASDRWIGLKYFDTSMFPYLHKTLSERILQDYLCLTIWDKTPKLSTQILKVIAGFAGGVVKN